MLKQDKSFAYILSTFPAITQTFVYREVQALREYGLTVHTLSIHRPSTRISAEAKPLIDQTFYIFPFKWLSLIIINLSYLSKRPLCYLGTVLFVLTRPGEPLNVRWRTLVHFLYSMFAVRELERLRPDHIHAHFGWSASTIALIASRMLGIPFSITLHSFYAKDAHPRHLLIEDKVREARFVVTISEYHRQILVKLMVKERVEDKIHVIHHGLDMTTFAPLTISKQQNNIFTIVGVGQLIACKGFHILLQACHFLVERGVLFHCYILGEGEERRRLKKMVEQYHLVDRVKLPGRVYQEELRQLLSQADVFALPCIRDEAGRQDGLPVVLTEAMAMELPVISTCIAGIPELITHEVTGLLTSPGDAVALADELQRLSKNPELRRQLGHAGRVKVLKDFNIRYCTDQLAQLLTTT